MASIAYSVGKSKTNPVSGEKKFLPTAQMRELITSEELCKHIADHNGTFARGTYMAVVSELVDCIREQLLAGNKVQVGDLGSFEVTLRSHGSDDYNSEADDADNWASSKIYAVKANYCPSDYFSNLIEDASFEEVMTREEQASAMKTYKAANATSGTGTGGTVVGG